MVVFACNACGASVKKNQVEKHYTQQCRRCESLSCMDCGKDFWGEDYKHHTKCISEDQKYAAKGWQPKASANKGERKQEAWIDAINAAVNETKDMTPQLRDLLTTITQYSNIPRKKKKFENFIGNSVHVRNRDLVEQAWLVFEKALVKPQEDQKPASEGDAAAAVNGSTGAPAEPVENSEREKPKKKKKHKAEKEDLESDTVAIEHKKSKREKKMERSKKTAKANGNMLGNGDVVTSKKKRKAEDIEEFDSAVQKDEGEAPKKKKKKNQQRDEVSDAGVERLNATLDESALMEVHGEGRFDWRGVVLSVLGGSGDGELPLKKLRKKVLQEFQARGCEGRPDFTREQIWAKLDKKLKKMTQVKVLKDNVRLVSA